MIHQIYLALRLFFYSFFTITAEVLSRVYVIILYFGLFTSYKFDVSAIQSLTQLN